MQKSWVRRALALAVVVLSSAGFVAAQAADSDGPPSAGQLGNVWYADPVYAPAGALATATWQAPEALTDPAVSAAPEDLPQGIPDAAREPEPVIPPPTGWAFGDGFPRTSGAGRYANGAYFWSDFLYDDNGAIGPTAPTNESTGAPSFGTYKYPEPEALRNGADIFRVAVGREGAETIWRVDWETLDPEDPTFPIAEFTIDSDNDPSTGVSDWPANAGVKSAGIDHALVLSAKAATLIDLDNNSTTDLTSSLKVDTNARSFVVKTSFLPETTSVVRVASGIADPATGGFKTLDTDHGAAPGQPNVYNVAFRDYTDEPSQTNTWYDTGQAKALTAGGDVSAFAATVDWQKLDVQLHASDPADRSDPERLLPGATNRWYVSTWKPTPTEANPHPQDQGIADPGQGISANGPAAYLGRVQPYQIFVPSTYDPDVPSSLTWMLHGASASHNSTQVHPRFLDLACERRNSICLSSLGRGPSGGYRTYAELDFWEVWNRVASTYSLDPKRTILTGNSMGAFGTYKIAMDHPEAFEAGVSVVGNATGAETGTDRLTNLRWMQLYARHGTADELVPISTEIETQNALNAQGLRHWYDFQPVEDHIVVALKDAYDDIAEFMVYVDNLPVVTPPAVISWGLKSRNIPTLPDVVPFEAAHKLNRPGAWWLQGATRRVELVASRIEAKSHAIDNPAVTPVQRDEPRLLGSPSPTLRHILEWELGATPATSQVLDATLTNIATLTIDLALAQLTSGPATLNISTDGTVEITLTHLGNRKITMGGNKINGHKVTLGKSDQYVIQIG